MEYYSEAVELLKCCMNCIRCESYTVTTASAYYCSAYRKYIDPAGRCPLYTPKIGYNTAMDEILSGNRIVPGAERGR